VGRISFVIAGMFLATFAFGRVESLVAHRGFGGSQAWAQDWYDSSGDSSSADDSQSKSMPPDISGTYTGTVVDHKAGKSDATIIITQNGGKLSGSFSTGFNHGTVKGTIKANDMLKLRLKIGGTCGANFHGVFENGDEISGVYSVSGCAGGNGDHGTVDVFVQ
jgi:hypothetical protein